MMNDLYVSLVDETGRPNGERVLLSEAKQPVRWAVLFVRDRAGRFWAPTRRDDLEHWPGMLDTVISPVYAERSYSEALRAGASAQLGLTDSQLTMVRTVAYLDPRKVSAAGFPLSGFMGVWELEVVDTDEFAPSCSGYFDSGRWYDHEEFLQLVATVDPCRDFRTLAQLCYGSHDLDLDSLRPNASR